MPESTTRRRDLILRSDPYVDTKFYPHDGSVVWNLRGTGVVKGTQMTESEGHPWTAKSRYKGQDVGGPFRTERRYIRDHRSEFPNKSPLYNLLNPGVNGGSTTHYFGPLYACNPHFSGNYNMNLSAESSDEDLLEFGTTAIARCKPTNSVANLATTFTELVREGVPSFIGSQLWRDRSLSFKNLGSEYLNVVFGWEPFIADLKSALYAAKHAEEIISQYEKDAGKLVRRRYTFPTERTVSSPVTLATGANPFSFGRGTLGLALTTGGPAFSASQGVLTRHTETVVDRSFSGAFTYYIPTGYSTRDKVRRSADYAGHLLGLEITPEVLWEVMPWSWAVDWVTNAGDAISNVSDFISDGLVMRYGYIMEHSIAREVYTLHNVPLKGQGATTFTLEKVREVKKRLPASPFGFGLTPESLSAKQVSILAALGMSYRR